MLYSGYGCVKKSCIIFIKLVKIFIILFLGICIKDFKLVCYINICTFVFIVVLFIIVKKWN